MTTKILLKPSDKLTEFSLTAVIDRETEGKYQAIVLGLPECQAEGNTREEAIANLSQLVTNRLEKAELISLAIQPPKPENPWMKFAGMYKDNPLFDEVVAYMEADRNTLDEEIELDYQQLDAEIEVK